MRRIWVGGAPMHIQHFQWGVQIVVIWSISLLQLQCFQYCQFVLFTHWSICLEKFASVSQPNQCFKLKHMGNHWIPSWLRLGILFGIWIQCLSTNAVQHHFIFVLIQQRVMESCDTLYTLYWERATLFFIQGKALQICILYTCPC